MKRFWSGLKEYRKECILGPAFKLLEAVFELIVPLIIARLVDEGLRQQAAPVVWRCVLQLVLMALLGLAASVTAQYFAARAAIGFSTALRHDLFAHIQSFSYADLDRFGSSTLITRITGDINQVQTGINLGLRLLLRSPFVVFGALIMACSIDPGSALVFGGVILALFLIVFGIILGTMPLQKKVREGLDGVTAATRENLSGVRVIRAFVQEENQSERFTRLNRLLTKIQLLTGRLTAAMNPMTFLVLNAGILLLIHTGALKVDGGGLTQGQLIALYNYMGQILVELVKLANLIVTLTKSAACARRVNDILLTPSSQEDGEALLPEGLEDLNETRLAAPETDGIIAAAETLPFMSDRRLVLLRDHPAVVGRADADDHLLTYLPSVPPTAVLLFYCVLPVRQKKIRISVFPISYRKRPIQTERSMRKY